MKTLKSALLGAKNLDDSNIHELMEQVKLIIKQHRAIIIQRLLGDLPTYLNYKFQISKPTPSQLDRVKDELLALKNSGVELTYYSAVVNQLETRASTHLTNEPFYVEIDAAMKHHLEAEKQFALNPQTTSL